MSDLKTALLAVVITFASVLALAWACVLILGLSADLSLKCAFSMNNNAPESQYPLTKQEVVQESAAKRSQR